MKKMKKVLCILLALTMALSLAACGSSSSSSTTTAAGDTEAADTEEATEAADSSTSGDAEVTIKFSLSHSSTEPPVVAAEAFAEEVEEKTNGAISVEIYPDGALGSERDVIEGLTLHTVEMVDPANAVITNFISELQIFSLPTLFENKEHLYAVLDDIGMSYADIFEENGFKLLGWFDLGSRNIMTVSTPINSMSDLKGLKIRNQESTVEMDGMAAFGASPTSMSYNELYTALSSSVVDGAEAANTNYYSKAFYEVAPYWAIVNWLECVNPVIIDLQVWESLTEEQQTIIEEAAQTMIESERELYAESEDEALALLEEIESVTITYPDRMEFVEASETVYDAYADELGRENIDAIINYDY